MKALHCVAWILAIVGALNWGLVGIGNFMAADWNLVELLIGSWSGIVANVVYVIVGVSGAYLLVTHKKDCKSCETAAPAGQSRA